MAIVLPNGEGTSGANEWGEVYANDKALKDALEEAQAMIVALEAEAITSQKWKPTAGVKSASSDLTLGEAFADVAGMKLEITPSVASTLLVVAIFDFELSQSGAAAQGSLKLDSETELTPVGELKSNQAAVERATIAQVYALPLTAGAHTIKGRAKNSEHSVTVNGKCIAASTQFLYLLFAS